MESHRNGEQRASAPAHLHLFFYIAINIMRHTLSFYLPQILDNHESTVREALEEGSLGMLLQLADISRVLISTPVPQSRIEHFKVSEKTPQIVRTLRNPRPDDVAFSRTIQRAHTCAILSS